MLRAMTYSAKLHTTKTLSHLKSATLSNRQPVLYLEGEITRERHDTDTELPFRQESNFYYLTGCETPGARLVVSAEKGNSSKFTSTLFIPPVDPVEVMWCGMPSSTEEIKKTHDVDDVKETTSLPSFLGSLVSRDATTVYTLPSTALPESVNTASDDLQTDDGTLRKAIHEARTQKTETELEFMRYANKVSSSAHAAVMKAIGQGAKSEMDTEAVFRAECIKEGMRSPAYLPIFAYGDKGATLHYVANNQTFDLTKGGMMVIDAGFEYNNYASDITRTVPIGNGGKFTDQCRSIYEIVLEMQKVALRKIKSGVLWVDIQLAMHRVAAAGLLKLGILQAGKSTATGDALVQELVDNHVSTPFFPHGIGHMLGLDTHDVGGLPEGKDKSPLLSNLRLLRPLDEGYVVTVEPGIYFNKFLLEPHKKSHYINMDVVNKYLGMGGVRIEDNVVVTKDGYENLTSAPKEVADVEKLCSGA